MPFETFYFRGLGWREAEFSNLQDTETLQRLLDAFQQVKLVSWFTKDIPPSAFLEALEAVPLGQRTFPRMLAVLSELPMQRAGKTRWGAKHPDMIKYIDMLYALYPDCHVIHVIRDIRGVVASRIDKKIKSIKKKGLPPLTYPGFKLPTGEIIHYRYLDYAADWVRDMTLLRRHVSEDPSRQFMEFRYEDLLRHPEQWVEKICDFIGEEFEPEMLSYYRDFESHLPKHTLQESHPNIALPPQVAIASRWKQRLSPTLIYAIQKAVGRVIVQEGYDLESISITSDEQKLIDREVTRWWRQRKWNAFRRMIGEVEWLRPIKSAYHRVRYDIALPPKST
jgi:hypothetical protein